MTTPASELLAAYDNQLRGEAEVRLAQTWDTAGPLWRASYGDRGLVTYEDLAGADLQRLVAETVAHFDAMPEVGEVEWKTRGHDDLPELHDVLVAAGFVPEEVETVMVGEAAALAVSVELPEGVRVRRIDDLTDGAERSRLLAATSAMQAAVFGRGGGGLEERVDRGGGMIEVWVAEAVGDRAGGIVCAGRLEVVPGTDFAGLWGGATLAAWRGQGLYRALTAARARSTLARGLTLMNSDCTAMSRPILERSGLVAVTTSTPYVRSRPAR